jgi:GT2 family glycosyltransferase
MQLSVIIVNYNVKYFLEQALHTVRKACNGIDAEILVVDNHSVDGSCEMVRKLFPEVKLIQNSENFQTIDLKIIKIKG